MQAEEVTLEIGLKAAKIRRIQTWEDHRDVKENELATHTALSSQFVAHNLQAVSGTDVNNTVTALLFCQ